METKELMKLSGVYQWKCLVNGKIYLGSTKRAFSVRKYEHLKELRIGKHHNKYFQSAWNKHGEKNFDFEIVEICDIETAKDREQYWLDALKPYNSEVGYNALKWAWGGSPKGVKRSEETRRKYSAIQKIIQKEIQKRPEIRKKKSENALRNWKNEEYRKKVVEGIANSPRQEEANKSRGEFARKRWSDPEYQARLSKAHLESQAVKDAAADPIIRKKISIKALQTWSDPEVRARRIAGMMSKITPEASARRGAAIREAKRRKRKKKLQEMLWAD